MNNTDKKSIALHKKHHGKIQISIKIPLKNKNDLSLAYTPGVAAVSLLVAKNPELSLSHTWRGNTVAVISDGSAVLGLGDIGPHGALPVMEGKVALFKSFAGIDAVPIVLATQDSAEIIKIVKALEPSFAGINLEDISAPRCFEIEETLRKELSIPVFHDDQHGTAIVVLAALTNALKIVKKKKDISIVINGAGAAAQAIFKLIVADGYDAHRITMLDSKGILALSRKDMDVYKTFIAKETKAKEGTLEDAIHQADVFIGVSKGNVLKHEHVETMSENPIVFAMANPDPEISFKEAQRVKIAVYGTGRSDYPNQINNVLVFPGLFRGALDAGVKDITTEMKLAAARAIESLVSKKELRKEYIIPKPFDKRVAPAVAKAVKSAGKKQLPIQR